MNGAEVNVAAKHKRAQHLAQLLVLRVHFPPHHSRFDHRVAFPVTSLLLVVIL
ncbi:Uncharacterised protein [Vibrio cholerae]|nr:Uncharacterised protein [Vibrio cholerae]CSI60007.1 Uncharacterised protein [Vibrio cholerae]